MAYENIRVRTEDSIGIVSLHRPEVLNALNAALMEELVQALEAFDRDDEIRCIILTGNERAFSAGADIKQMVDASAVEMLRHAQPARWERVRRITKPLIAAVSGYALGGGCELCMCCDIIVASETARFGQPEINIGIIPGAGGTQRLTRAVGKYLAMEMVLTGRFLDAWEAHRAGLVSRVVPVELYLEEAKGIAREICGKSPLAVRVGKEAVLRAQDTTLEMGLDYERRSFALLFASEDKREGMQAFLDKRKAKFTGR